MLAFPSDQIVKDVYALKDKYEKQYKGPSKSFGHWAWRYSIRWCAVATASEG